METAKAVVQAGRLKPYLRLSRAISEYGQVLDEIDSGNRIVFKNIQARSRPTEAHEVTRLAERLNRDGSRLHRTWKPYATRLLSFLEQIRTFAKAGDVLVGGSQNMIACGVWATVRVCLEVVIGHLALFERLSRLWMTLGRLSTIYDDIVALYPAARDLQDLMCEYLIVVVELCKRVTIFTSRRTIFQLTSQLTSSVEGELRDFEASLKAWGVLIEQKVNFLRAKSQQESAGTLARIANKLSSASGRIEKMHNAERRMELFRRLSRHQDQFELEWRRLRRKGTAAWIFEDENYLGWRRSAGSSHLCIHGTLGSGKSVLMANIVAVLHSEHPCGDIKRGSEDISSSSPMGFIVASFFTPGGHRPGSIDDAVILGSLAFQLIRGCGESVMQSTLGTDSEIDAARFWSNINGYLPGEGQVFVILDGLEELQPEVSGHVLETLRRASLSCNRLHICASCQTSSPFKAMLREYGFDTSVSMTNNAKDKEIEEFIESEIERRSKLCDMSTVLAEAVKDALTVGAQGMYLWAALQLERVLPQYRMAVLTDSDVRNILADLPVDLNAAFQKALESIYNPKYGGRIFQVVAAAERPLTTRELRVALNVRPGVPSWDGSTMVWDPVSVVVGCGGGLLEIDEEYQTVHFIHHSALAYLLHGEDDGPGPHRLCFGLPEASQLMASISVAYLHFPMHNQQLVLRQREGLKPKNVVIKVTEIAASQGRVGKILTHLRQRHEAQLQERDFDISRVLDGISSTSTRNDESNSEALILLDYVQEYWLQHTRDVVSDSVGTQTLLHELFRSTAPHVPKPWTDGDWKDALKWAWENDHTALLQYASLKTWQPPVSQYISRLPKAELIKRYYKKMTGRSFSTILVSYALTAYLSETAAGLDWWLTHAPLEWRDLCDHTIFSSPLKEIGREPDLEIIKRFLQAGADPETPLWLPAGPPILDYFVARQPPGIERLSAVRYLLELGAPSMSAPASWILGQSALGNAIVEGDFDLVHLLIAAGVLAPDLQVVVNTDGQHAEELARQNGRISLFKATVETCTKSFTTDTPTTHFERYYRDVALGDDRVSQSFLQSLGPVVLGRLLYVKLDASISVSELQNIINAGGDPGPSIAKAMVCSMPEVVASIIANGVALEQPAKADCRGKWGFAPKGYTPKEVFDLLENGRRNAILSALSEQGVPDIVVDVRETDYMYTPPPS
ncbi:uncharacterized protein DNG_01737 [Cephalotrichum gorgonifer]|uniref:Nephrocystin 3-like N-terminal domain-containing protein n=1 Tax=Cephalotrichum gorgonifer TaxID=2041049 RepID=A0AAE8SSK1_9PEZI|nr:uncharacterized protein DNG_01737 [Cephalotrichum gorgonifer]